MINFLMLKILYSFLALLPIYAEARDLKILVSDIDDTIKVSHVLDKDSTVANAFTRKNSFLGMAELYQALKREKSVDQIYYLSNAPVWLMYPFHKKFLKRTGFPVDGLILRKDIRDRDHKVSALRHIILTQKPSELLLIGDNGEQDTVKYHKIAKEFPQLKITTYIHQAYSQIEFNGSRGQLLEKNQIGFATSIDLAADLFTKKMLSPHSYRQIMTKLAPLALTEDDEIERGKPMMFPAWFDCRDFTLHSLPVPSIEEIDLVEKMEQRIRERCAREPYED